MTEETWAVVSDEREVERAIASGEAPKLLATTPIALYTARKRDVPVTPLDAYLDAATLDTAAGNNIEYVNRLVDRLDTRLHETCESLSEHFRPFQALDYELRVMLNALCFRSIALQEFLSVEEPATLVGHGTPADREGFVSHTDDRPLAWRSGHRPTRAILETEAFRSGTDTTVRTPENPAMTGGGSHDPGIKAVVRRLANPNRTSGLKKTRMADVARRGGKRLTLIELNGPIHELIRDSISTGRATVDWWKVWERDPVSMRTGRTIRLPDPEPSLGAGTVGDVVSGTVPDLESHLTTPAAEVLHSRLERNASAVVPEYQVLFDRAAAYFRSRDPACVLCGPNLRPRPRCLTQAAVATDIPVAALQHGGGYGYLNMEKLYKEAEHDMFCSWGSGATEELAAHLSSRVHHGVIRTLGVRRTRVNGIRFEELPEVAPPRSVGGRLAYVADGLMGHRWSGSNAWYGDVAYYRFQRDLVDALATLDKWDVVLRPHPKDSTANPLEQYARSQGYDELDFHKGDSLASLAAEAEVVLTDTPHTALLELLLQGVPVVYLDKGWMEWTDIGREPLTDALPVIEWDTLEGDGGSPAELREILTTAAEFEYNYDPFLRAFAYPAFDAEAFWKGLTEVTPAQAD